MASSTTPSHRVYEGMLPCAFVVYSSVQPRRRSSALVLPVTVEQVSSLSSTAVVEQSTNPQARFHRLIVWCHLAPPVFEERRKYALVSNGRISCLQVCLLHEDTGGMKGVFPSRVSNLCLFGWITLEDRCPKKADPPPSECTNSLGYK